MDRPRHFHSLIAHTHRISVTFNRWPWQRPQSTEQAEERKGEHDKYFLLIFSSAINSSSSTSYCAPHTHTHTRFYTTPREIDVLNLWYLFFPVGLFVFAIVASVVNKLNRSDLVGIGMYDVRAFLHLVSLSLHIGYNIRDALVTTTRCGSATIFASSDRCCPWIVNKCDMWLKLNCNWGT